MRQVPGSLFVLSLSVLLALTGRALAQPTANSEEQALKSASNDYKEYLKQLKALNEQYKQVTTEVQKVLKDNGVPAWDENEGGIKIVEYKEDEPARNVSSTDGFGKVDVQEAGKEVTVRADMPGFAKNDIRIKVNGGSELSIKALRRNDMGEFPYERIVKLPSAVSEKTAQAKYENGILTVRLEKLAASPQEVSIPIQ